VKIRSLRALAEKLERRFDAGVGAPWTDAAFQELALAAFALQFERIPSYRAFCQGRGRTPDTVERWEDVPAVPSSAFKALELFAGDGEPPEAIFRTSGTTLGEAARGRHLVPRLELYRRSLLPPFRSHVLAARGRIRFVSLIPAPDELPDSSLSFMVGTAAAELASATHWLVDGEGELDLGALRAITRRASHAREPVLILGTALALLNALERLEGEPLAPLPPGSRIMETGGFKGAGRELTRVDLYSEARAGDRRAARAHRERVRNDGAALPALRAGALGGARRGRDARAAALAQGPRARSRSRSRSSRRARKACSASSTSPTPAPSVTCSPRTSAAS
jgi:hypothetical protein